MNRRTFFFQSAAIVLIACAIATAASASVDPVGDELQLDDPRPGALSSASTIRNQQMDRADDGSFVVVWRDFSDGSTFGESIGVSARRFASDGTPLTGNIRVNTYTTGNQTLPAVSSRPDGSFIVVWEDQSDVFGAEEEIHGRVFNADGSALSDVFTVNRFTTGIQKFPTVTHLSNTTFIVAWMDGDTTIGGEILARRFTPSGTPAAGDFRLNTDISFDHTLPVVEATSNGFIAVWESILADGEDAGIFAKRFDNLGNVQGTEFQVNSYTTNAQSAPSLAVSADDEFVVVWTSRSQDGSADGIYAKTYAADGSAVSGELRVAENTNLDQREADVAFGAEGFVVSWTNEAPIISNNAVNARCFDSAGNAIGGEFVAGSAAVNVSNSSVIGGTEGQGFVVGWSGPSPVQPGGTSVLAQRFGDIGASSGGTCGDPVEDGMTTASDALFILQAGVGLESCEPCVCDVNSVGGITATDALVALQAAVGLGGDLMCPAC